MIDDPERQKVLRRILKWLNIQKTDTILDIGCGDGFFSKNLSLQTSDANVVSCDIRKSMKGNSNLRLVICDAQHIPFKDKSFDKIVMLDVLEHMFNGKLACDEIYRVLVAGGRAYVATPNSYTTMLSPFKILAQRVDSYEGHLHHFSLEELSNIFSGNKLRTLHFQYDGFFALFSYYSFVYFVLKPLAKRKSATSSHNLSESRIGQGFLFQLLSGVGKHFLVILGKFDEFFKSSNRCMEIHLVVVKSSEKTLMG